MGRGGGMITPGVKNNKNIQLLLLADKKINLQGYIHKKTRIIHKNNSAREKNHFVKLKMIQNVQINYWGKL